MALSSLTVFQRFVLLAPLLVLGLFVLWRAAQYFKGDGRYAGILLGYSAVMLAIYLRRDYFFFQKLVTPAVPVLLIPVVSVQWGSGLKWRQRLPMWAVSLLLAGALLGLARNGYRQVVTFYDVISEARQTYVDPAILLARSRLVAGKGGLHVFGVDPTPERHLLLRQIFADQFWRPERDEEIWPEFGLTEQNIPPEVNARYDLVVAAHDYHGPVDYRRLNEHTFAGALGPKVDAFGPGSTVVEFDKAWEPTGWTRVAERDERTRGMLLKNGVTGAIAIIVQGRAPDLRIAVSSPARNDIRVFLNGVAVGPLLPLQGGAETVISVSCSQLCRNGENTLSWTQSGTVFEVTGIS